MKKYILGTVALSLAFGAFADESKAKNDTVGGFKFTDVKLVKTTPVKDQKIGRAHV